MKLSCFGRNLFRETNESFLGSHALAEGLLLRFAVHIMLLEVELQ